MTPELTKLTWVLVLHMVCWIPYVLNRTMVQGIMGAVGYPDNPAPLAPWAERAKRAHYNGVENLVVFAAIVLLLHAVGISNDTTVLACTAYFWARLAHYLVFAAGIPWLRTITFFNAWLATGALILQVL